MDRSAALLAAQGSRITKRGDLDHGGRRRCEQTFKEFSAGEGPGRRDCRLRSKRRARASGAGSSAPPRGAGLARDKQREMAPANRPGGRALHVHDGNQPVPFAEVGWEIALVRIRIGTKIRDYTAFGGTSPACPWLL